jgi:phosphopantothenoylcysteine decarboxylase/phosphopantothenate--cysteine ligase
VTGLRGRRVLLGVTGGIAAYKAASLARELQRAGADVTAVLTASATRFIGADTFAGLTGHPAYTSLWESPGEVVHIRLAQAHELAVIAPATGNLIAKLAHGLADDLLSATLLEFDGPVVEPIDPVRYVGNRSSGKMGVAVATEALARGARVTLVLGPDALRPPVGVDVIEVETAEEMRSAVLAHAPDAEVIVMAAAVADFRPKLRADRKLKKDDGVPELQLEPTPDILAELGEHRRPGQILVGFAAETNDVERAGRDKLARKGLDLLVANLVGRAGTGFGTDTNEAAILVADGEDEALRRWTKAELAGGLWDRIADRLPPAATA